MAITTRMEQSLTICPNGCINVRDEKIMEDNGVELARTFHRRIVDIVDDITNESQRLKDIASAIWTPEVKKERMYVLDALKIKPHKSVKREAVIKGSNY